MPTPRTATLFLLLSACGSVDPEARTAPNATSSSALPIDAIRNAVEARFATLQAPGAAYGMWRGKPGDTQPELLLLLGSADEQKTRPIRRDDHFRIGSVTKLFTGTVVLQLFDEGKLQLDDPVSKYVSGVPNGERITIAMLGYHTSGLGNVIASRSFQKAVEAAPSAYWETDAILQYAFAMLPRFTTPGERIDYSNTNTIVLGEVIRAVTGKPWHEEVQRRIVEPLGLRHTGFTKNARPPEPTPRGYRFGRKDGLIRYGDFWFDATDWSGSWSGAAGNLYGTLDDIAVFTRAFARGELVGPKGREALFRFEDAGYDGLELGFHASRYSGAIGSMGDLPGASAFAYHLPDLDVTIVSLANLTATIDKRTAAAELGELTIALLHAPAGAAAPAK